MSKMKRLKGNGVVGFVAFVIAWFFALAFLTTFFIHPAHAASGDEKYYTKPQPNQQPHVLYQTKDGYIQSFTIHKDRVTCLRRTNELKLKPGTWQCLPS